MSRIKFCIEFYFHEGGQLWLLVSAFWEGKRITLSHSAFLLFLYNNESELHNSDLDFAYRLAKYLTKVRVDGMLTEAITSDEDMAWFFERARKSNATIVWKSNDKETLVTFDDPLPVKIDITPDNKGIMCTMTNWQEWMDDPLLWMHFTTEDATICFGNGSVAINPSTTLLKFIDEFLTKESVRFAGKDTVYFIQQIYKPNKHILQWTNQVELGDYVPNEEPPTPKLTLVYANGILTPTLTYLYGEEEIPPDFEEEYVKNRKTGKMNKRLRDMETVYQQDLIDIFMEYDLPFMLQIPGDIAKFLDRVVPILKKRDWKIVEHTEEFAMAGEPMELNFSLKNSGQDLFYFEPNMDIDGKPITYREIARLMVENQGYLKTDRGFVKIADKSQKELKNLNDLGAFEHEKKFMKIDLMPLIASSRSIEGDSQETQMFLDQFHKIHKVVQVKPGKGFKGELRDYQQFGVNWINFLHTNGFGGVLADDMGLGKTVQTIAFCTQLKSPGPILVVGPTNVIYNWEQEIQKFTDNKTSLIYTGPGRQKFVKDMENYDFVITSFGILKKDLEEFQSIEWEAIFIDEAQHIKNPQTQVSKAVKQLKSKFRIAMSGTPIENHLIDLWNIFDFVMPKYLGSHREFENDVKNATTQVIKTKIKPFVLRREKREVLDSLPEKTEIVLKCEMTKEQADIYQTVLSAAKQGIRNTEGKNERLNVLTALLKLRQVCIHPGLLAEFKGQDIKTAKFDLAKEKIAELIDEGHKIVLFSQFTGMLDIMQKWCKESNIQIERIDGSITAKDRMNAVNRFQNSTTPTLFLISLKAGGVGLNLTAADYVIHLDPWWNPAIEAQATDRVHRMGQQNKVIVYKFITEGTVEEKIQSLQESKKALLAEIIDIDSAAEKKLNFDEIRNILMQ
ncbi:MAG: DEAD/DEAH box helicase [bacterium]|nr:DEAD/DEAH box helicase [bacterium]